MNIAHAAQGFAQQELERIEATLATLQTWAELVRSLGSGWDDVEKLRAIANQLETIADYWNGRMDGNQTHP